MCRLSLLSGPWTHALHNQVCQKNRCIAKCGAREPGCVAKGLVLLSPLSRRETGWGGKDLPGSQNRAGPKHPGTQLAEPQPGPFSAGAAALSLPELAD